MSSGLNPATRCASPSHVDCAAVPLPGSSTRRCAVSTPGDAVATRRDRPVRGHVRPPARRPSRHGGQRAPRARPRRRRPDGRQRALAEAGQPPDHPGRRPPGDGRGGGRRRPRAGGRAARDRPRRAELHGRHAGRARRAASPASSCSRSSATTPPPGWPTWERHEEVVARSTMVVVDRPASRSSCPTTCLDPRRGAPPRGVEHRPAGPVRRRPPARLPGHRPGAPGDRRAGPLREGRRDGPRRPSPPSPPSSPGSRPPSRSVLAAALGVLGAVTLYNSTEGADPVAGRPGADVPGHADRRLAVVDDGGALASIAVLVVQPAGAGGQHRRRAGQRRRQRRAGDERAPARPRRSPCRAPTSLADEARGRRSACSSTTSRCSTRPARRAAGAARRRSRSTCRPTSPTPTARSSPRPARRRSTPRGGGHPRGRATRPSRRAEQYRAADRGVAGVAAAVGDGRGAAPAARAARDGAAADDLGAPGDAGDRCGGRVGVRPAAVRSFKSTPIVSVDQPPRVDAVVLDRVELALVFGQIAPSAVAAPEPGLTFRVVSTFSDEQLAASGRHQHRRRLRRATQIAARRRRQRAVGRHTAGDHADAAHA